MPAFEHAFDDRAETFLQVGDVARIIAERHCSVEVDTITHVRWRELLGLLREVDTLADETTLSSEDILRALTDFTDFSDRYPSLSPESLDAPMRQAMIDRTRRILKLGQHVAEAESVPRLVALRIMEGKETAGYLSDAASPFVASQPNFQNEFMPVMESMAVSANLIDSMTDGRMDYKAGKLSLHPDKIFYQTLVKNTWVRGGLGGQALRHVPVMKEFAVMSWNRLVNRVKHRDSATTSLNIFRDNKIIPEDDSKNNSW